ncbi:pectinesterase family protein [Croceibacterium ferulae]|uniref:pectinesterase family protein n=1 Tax=Croceibacterium ferulae TaxID=1854641 RepID=UPI001587FF5F|nr:pectinesterase family protein [Croceibacterium ferulae]
MMNRLIALLAGVLLLGGAPALAQEAPEVQVSADAPGAQRSVQAAIDALPDSGGIIRIAPGVWREKLTVAKSGVTLIGTGLRPEDTVLVFNDSAMTAGGTGKSGTLTASGDDLRIGNLTIQNDWWLDPANPPSQAVALLLTGDRAVLYRVRLLGHQDTLYANKGRQYFFDSYVEGHVDFIFGNANAYWENCRIHGLAGAEVMITAQSRNAADEDSAYVFDRATVTAEPAAGPIWLGRPWRDHSRVIFLDSHMDADVHPAGWREWTPGTTNKLPTTFYAEHASTGRGASPETREPLSHQLSAEEAERWRLEAFFKGDTDWIRAGLAALR